jgi:hypothetical protein
MKRSLIFFISLIVLCAMPVFASTPEQDMVLIVDEGEQDFSGLQQVSDEEMAQVEGDRVIFEEAVPTIGSTNDEDSPGAVWHDIIVVYGSNGYAIIEWNGWVITDINHDGSITAEDLTEILIINNVDDQLADIYANTVFHNYEYQDFLDQQAYLLATKR